ncbi:MAG: hypothetical protein ACP5I4_13800 [Oceanipulchritudo sp.]
MPHFENLEQYESRNPKGGRQRIIPIAPHSLQAADYRPRRRAQAPERQREKAPAFPGVEIEPVSVQQMEKEFRLTNRKLNRRSKRHTWKSRKRGFLQWLKSLFGKQTTDSPKGERRRKPRPDRKRGGGSERRPEQGKKEGPPDGEGGQKRRRKRNRSRGKPQGQGKHQGQPSHTKDAGKPQSSQEGKGKSGGSSRNRRNRSRRPRGGRGNNQGSGHSG